MDNYTNKCSLFSSRSGCRPNEQIYQVITFFSFKVSCVLLSLRKGEASASLRRAAQYISHADLCKFLPQRLDPDWLKPYTPAEESELNPLFAWLDATGCKRGRQEASRQPTSPRRPSSDMRKTPTHASARNMTESGSEALDFWKANQGQWWSLLKN